MRGNEFLDKMELVESVYFEAADISNIKKGKKSRVKVWFVMAACACLFFVVAVPTAAATVPAFYDALYLVSPSTAQFFKPVQLSCNDNNIRMEIIAMSVNENVAEIYISMQDLEGGRINENIDLFDSYQINTPFSSTNHCTFLEYDSDTNTATFLVTIEQWDAKKIVGDKITFSVGKFLSNKERFDGVIEDVDFKSEPLSVKTQMVNARGLSGDLFNNCQEESENKFEVLLPEKVICEPVQGAKITGIGYVDEKFHVQVYYEDIGGTDNHGFISLMDKNTNEIVECDGSISFFDGEAKGSYQDYIFTSVNEDILDDYSLYGEFIMADNLVEGNWSVTFPLENR